MQTPCLEDQWSYTEQTQTRGHTVAVVRQAKRAITSDSLLYVNVSLNHGVCIKGFQEFRTNEHIQSGVRYPSRTHLSLQPETVAPENRLLTLM